MDGREFNAYKLSRSVYPSIFNSFPVIRTASAKNRRFHVPQPTFFFPLETPLRLSRNMLHRWKDNSVLAKSLAACTYLSSIISELYDAEFNAQVQKSLFYHIFVSPGDAPGAITLNAVWVEREFDAYKLSRCMCPSNYNRFWDRARYLWKKSRHFIIPPLHSTPPLGGGVPVGISAPLWYGRTRMVSLCDGEKNSKICLFVLTWSTNVTDGQRDRQTDGQSDTAWQQRPRLHSIAR